MGLWGGIVGRSDISVAEPYLWAETFMVATKR